MKNKEALDALLDAIELIDDKYILEAETGKSQKKENIVPFRKRKRLLYIAPAVTGICAAALILIIAGNGGKKSAADLAAGNQGNQYIYSEMETANESILTADNEACFEEYIEDNKAVSNDLTYQGGGKDSIVSGSDMEMDGIVMETTKESAIDTDSGVIIISGDVENNRKLYEDYFAEHEYEILYYYEVYSGYAVRIPDYVDIDEAIEDLKKLEGIYSVEKDHRYD